ncbi:MAG: RNA polymerase sigma-54 factor, partial [Candidatus Binatia bacterium]
MAFELKQVQRLAQQLVMTPQLQQAIKLLQLSRIELEEMISEELQENPVLEEEIAEEGKEKADGKVVGEGENPETLAKLTRELSTAEKIGSLNWQEYMDTHSNSIHGSLTAEASREDDDGPPSWETALTRKTSLEDHMVWQLRLSRLTQREETIGLYMIGNLDVSGYLAVSLEEVNQSTESTIEEVETILKRIQLFDPVGVAARDLKECLLIQLEALDLGT